MVSFKFRGLFGISMPTGEANGSPAESSSSKPPSGRIRNLLVHRSRRTATKNQKTTIQQTERDIASISSSRQTELEQELARVREENNSYKNEIQEIESAYSQIESSKYDDSPIIVVPTNVDTSGPLVDDYVPDGKRDDHYFSTKFNEIRIRIREWVVLTFFKPGVNPTTGFLNLSPTIRDEIFQRVFKGVPDMSIDNERIDSKMVRCILQAYIADAVNDFAFNSYVPGIEMGENIPKLEELMDKCHASESHSWKALTLSLITKNENYSQVIEQKIQEFTLGIANSLCDLYHISSPSTDLISRTPPPFNPRKAARTLATILKFTTKVVLEMRAEPFIFETYMCGPGDLCANAKWPVSDDGGKISDDEQRESQARILFTLFPALIRHGRGDLETACLVKACVLLA